MLVVGSFCIMGDWDRAPPPEDKHIIRLEPSPAWGIGTHISTRLLLEELPGLIQPGMSFLDIGCGAGIPMIAAAKLGAKASGYEMNEEAAAVASRNANNSDVVCEIINTRWTCGVKLEPTYDLVYVNTGIDDLVREVLDCPGLARVVITHAEILIYHNAWDLTTQTGALKVFTRITP